MTALALSLVAIGGVAGGWFLRGFLSPRRESPEAIVSDEAVSDASPHRREGGVLPAEAPARGPDSDRHAVSPGSELAGRVIVHLARLGRLPRDEVGAVGFTQKGMRESLRVPQGSIAKTLSRLRSAGVVEVDRRHVRNQPRRLKVYTLTALGESVARDILHPAPGSARVMDPVKAPVASGGV